MLAKLASLALLVVSAVRASVYVTNPVQSSSCTGGQPCQVGWVDNGEAPVLSKIGQCNVGLYTGEFQLVQALPSVDVSSTSSFTFTPNPDVGPNGQYYLVFSSSSINYQAFSGSFALTGLTGTTPTGGSSTPTSRPTTSSGSSISMTGSTTPATGTTSGTTSGTATTPSGTSTPSTVGTTTPTGSTTAVDTTTATTASPTLTTPTVTTSTPMSSTSMTTTTSSKTTTSASATPTNGAGRVASTSLGGLAALFVLSAVLAF